MFFQPMLALSNRMSEKVFVAENENKLVKTSLQKKSVKPVIFKDISICVANSIRELGNLYIFANCKVNGFHLYNLLSGKITFLNNIML